MAWSLRAVLMLCTLAPTLLAGRLLVAYPTPVDFSGRLLAWPLERSAPRLTYELIADDDGDYAEFASVVDEAAQMWSEVEASFIRLEAFDPTVEPGGEAQISINLKRMIEDAAYSSGYTEFDALDQKGVPVHCTIVIHADPSFTFNAIAKTVLHEIGHCLGLGHSLIPEAIMSYRLTRNSFALDIDDKAALSRLYPSDPTAKRLPPGCAIGAGPLPGATSGLLAGLLLGLPLLVSLLLPRRSSLLRRSRLS